MNTPFVLSALGEETWLDLRHHVEWAEGFALIVLFSSNPALQSVLRERLASIYRTRVSHLQHVTPHSPETLVAEVMSLIRTPSELHESSAAPLWLDISADRDEAWEYGRKNLLERLNEHRELLRQRLRRPFILVLPSGYRQRLRELAPDLWSIRSVSLDLDELTLIRRDEGVSTAGPGLDRYELMTQPPSPPTFFEEAQWREWERLQRSGTQSHDMLLVGWRATDAALATRQLQKAAQIAAEVLNLARWLAVKGEARDMQETVRDLSIALDNVGDVARALGRLEEADTAYRESLALRREQRAHLGDTPETVRALIII